jgi:hypothetical protein
MVNEQLAQLYLDMDLENLSVKLSLEESISLCDSSSISSGGEETQPINQAKQHKSNKFYKVYF